jgi:hypothetical protein
LSRLEGFEGLKGAGVHGPVFSEIVDHERIDDRRGTVLSLHRQVASHAKHPHERLTFSEFRANLRPYCEA